MMTLASYLATADDIPAVISSSYSAPESILTQKYSERTCNDFMKAGARGVTILFSSGDQGVSGTTEVASRAFHSGGGFSDIFNTPEYQKADVEAYLRNHVPASYDGKFDKTGRAYPDIALMAERIPCIGPTPSRNNSYPTQPDVVLGTSASSPIVAGLLSQMNDYRATLKLPMLGFINPRLYNDPKVHAALNDITSGRNRGCGTNGFSAEKGWDPVTGLGSLNFAKLRAALST
ncbi:hypothetical protein VHEMI10658 [[Torrubiella] hemipterigena]|uniref:Peptidase S53 domain-containing protein n=1 Tax=[Torrubiella] hemipterigena TaxID=1531966 RepID=A0A0A1TSA5_9HYPO|nr:hypothetical protein VHEMI10658 [[Torrubiella] hemipterigena]